MIDDGTASATAFSVPLRATLARAIHGTSKMKKIDNKDPDIIFWDNCTQLNG